MSQPPIGNRSWYPKRLGRFKVDGLIAQGTAGLVLSGHDEDGSRVALKLAEQIGVQARHRFHQEINACRRLNHPHIIKIRGSGEFDGRPWYAMDFHGRATLRDLIVCNTEGIDNDVPSLVRGIRKGHIRPTNRHRRLLPQTAALNLIMDIGGAIAHAHGRGLIHRDLKPENVLIRDDGQPVVCDFGLVKDLAADSANTGTGRFLGTIGYQAPEQREAGRSADERADVFALGVMLEELLTGRTPKVDLFAKTQADGPEARQRRELDRALRLIIARATHPEPMRRYHSVQALVTDLERFQRGEPVQARRDPAWLRLHRWSRRHRLASGLLVIGLALLATVLVVDYIATRLQEATWTKPLARLSLSDPADLARLEQIQGSWEIEAAGIRPRLHRLTPHLLAHSEPRSSALRLRTRVDLPALGELGRLPSLGLFAANATGRVDDGYYWELGAYDNSCSVLRRGDRLLWTGDHRLRADTTYEIELEISDETLVGRIDGKQLFAVTDATLLANGQWGIRVDAHHQADVPPTFSDLSIRARTVPTLQEPADYPRLMVSLFERANLDQRLATWSLVREACRGWRDSRQAGSDAYRQANLLLLRAYALAQETFADTAFIGAEQQRRLVEDIDQLLQQESDEIQVWLAAKELRWRHVPAARDTMLASLRLHVASEPGDRAAIRLWMLNLGSERYAWPLLAEAVDWTTEELAPVDWIIAAAVLRQIPWHAASRHRAETILLADGSVGLALRSLAAEHHLWRQQLTDAAVSVETTPAARERFAARFACFQPTAAADDPPAVIDFVHGRNPSARFEYWLADDPVLLNDWDRHWLGQNMSALLPSPYSWGLPLAGDAGLESRLLGYLKGEHGWEPVAELLAERGVIPGDYPWHRLLLCRLLLRGAGADRQQLIASLPQQGLDLWFSGLVWRWLGRDTIPMAELDRYGTGVRAVVACLGGTAGSQGIEVPRWHPNRPGLELLLALHDLRHGHVAAAQPRLTALRDQGAGWPESLAAALALEHLRR